MNYPSSLSSCPNFPWYLQEHNACPYFSSCWFLFFYISHSVEFVLLSGENNVCGLHRNSFGEFDVFGYVYVMEKATLDFTGSNGGRGSVLICQIILPFTFPNLNSHKPRLLWYTVNTGKISFQLATWHSTGAKNEFLWVFLLKSLGFLETLWDETECSSKRSGKQLPSHDGEHPALISIFLIRELERIWSKGY